MEPQHGADPDNVQRASDVLELLAKVAGSVGILWAFGAKVVKPFIEWRYRRLKTAIRESLKEELECVADLADPKDGWKARVERLERLALDNQERHNETNELLDFLGFTSDRRSGSDRRNREEINQIIDDLNSERRHERRRRGDQLE